MSIEYYSISSVSGQNEFFGCSFLIHVNSMVATVKSHYLIFVLVLFINKCLKIHQMFLLLVKITCTEDDDTMLQFFFIQRL